MNEVRHIPGGEEGGFKMLGFGPLEFWTAPNGEVIFMVNFPILRQYGQKVGVTGGHFEMMVKAVSNGFSLDTAVSPEEWLKMQDPHSSLEEEVTRNNKPVMNVTILPLTVIVGLFIWVMFFNLGVRNTMLIIAGAFMAAGFVKWLRGDDEENG